MASSTSSRIQQAKSNCSGHQAAFSPRERSGVNEDVVIRVLFRRHGAADAVRRVVAGSLDEAVFIVSAEDLLGTRVRELMMDLQALLRRKVWITTDPSGTFGEATILGSP